MKLNTKLTKLASGILAVGGLLMASQANAATVSLTPDVVTVSGGETFTMTVSATGFDLGASAGSIVLNWDTASVGLAAGVTQGTIVSSLSANGFSDPLVIDLSVAGQLEVTAGIGFFNPPVAGPDFNFFSLDFTAVSPPAGSNLAIDMGSFGFWQDAAGLDITAVTYNSATIAVSSVPVPPAVWLFGSGLIGLVGIARRRSPQLA